MPRKHYQAEEIIPKLREAEMALAQGKSTGEVCKKLGVAECINGVVFATMHEANVLIERSCVN